MYVLQDSPKRDIVYYGLGLVVAEVAAEVTDSIRKKTEAKIRWATSIARQITEVVAPNAQAIMACSEPVAELKGPRAAKELRSFKPLIAMHPRARKVITKFLDEHGVLVENGGREAMLRYFDWLPQRVEELRARVREFEEGFAASLKEDREQLRQLHETWSEAETDGLETL